MRPLYQDPWFTFRFADDRRIPRFHLEGVQTGQRVSVLRIDPATGERLGLLAMTTVGEGGWVELAEPISVRAGEAFIAVPATLVAGVDGCPGGWICVVRDAETGEVSSTLFRTAAALVSRQPCPEVIAIDIPIGLTEAGQRACDQRARGLLGGTRQRSVFPSPIRAALHAASRPTASRITLKADGRKVGAQSWGIYPKVRELDAILSSDATLQRRVREVHPELCFWAWNEAW